MSSSETVSITSDALTATIATQGSELVRLQDGDGRDLQWDGDPAVWHGRAPILFPVIGLLIGGEYRLDGKTYQMPKHGFARHSRFEIVDAEPSRATLRLDASDATRACYPFEFRLEIEFALADQTLSVTARIANRGDTAQGDLAMPASFGFHPALRWPLPYGAPRDDHHIRFDHPEPAPVRRIDADGFLKAEGEPTSVEGDDLHLRDALFVDDALIFDRLTSRRVVYRGGDGPGIAVRFDDFPTLGVWTKPGAGFVCIEPWQGFSDPEGFTGDIRDKPGMIEIAPGASHTLAMHLSLVN